MVRRGEVFWLDLGGAAAATGSVQAGRRPVVIIQNEVGNRASPITIIAAITSQPRSRSYPFHVAFPAGEAGLPLAGIILCEQIQTIDQGRLGTFVGAFGIERMREVDVALHRSLGLEH